MEGRKKIIFLALTPKYRRERAGTVLLLLCILCCWSTQNFAQTDSSILVLDKLYWEDIQFEKKRLLDIVISGSRTVEQRKDATDKVYVITKKEIHDNGYYTLVDVMASLPGIKTSQPGSGQDGETFYMRGLLGNTYAKILINDIPIKSFVAKSLGISSQLPIRQAERIEVIYGTKASIYGVDASAGIINIILPQGKSLEDGDFDVDISYGSNNLRKVNFFSANNFRIKKKQLRTSIYGGYTQFDDWNVIPKGDSSLFRLDNYIQTSFLDSLGNEVDSIQSFLPHYDRDNYEGTDVLPELGSLPGQSNYLGMNASYGAFTFGGLYASRQDHTGIGRSPIFTTYHNPLNYFKENTLSLSLAFDKRWSKLGIKTSVNYLDYEVDPTSNENKISTPFLEIIDGASVNLNELAFLQYERFVVGSKYTFAFSREWEFDQLFYYDFNKFFNTTVGLKYKEGEGTPISSLFSDSESAAASVDNGRIGDYKLYSAFIQNSTTISKLKVDLGLHYSYYDIPGLRSDLDSLIVNDNLNFQVSALYDLNENSQLRLRSGTAFRIPSPYYRAQSFTAQPGGLSTVNLLPETTYSGEIVYSWTPNSSWSVDLSTYWSKTNNLINFGRQIDSLSSIPELVYANDENNQIELWGLQAHLRAQKLNLPLNTSFDITLNFAKGNEVNSIDPLVGVDTALTTVVYPALQGFPTFMAQFNLSFDILDGLKLKLFNTFNSQTLSIGQSLNKPLTEFNYSEGFYRLNLQLNYQLTPNLTFNGRVNNVFDTSYGGIDATETVENLIYNPQPQRNFLFSLNYNLNN